MSLGFICLFYNLFIMVTFIAVREYYEVLKSVPGMRVRLEKPLMREDL